MMFKGLMAKAAKSVWDSTAPGSAPPETEATHDAPQSPEETAEPEITAADLGIQLPYEPGEGTSCAAACRCRWQVEIRWSPEHASNASFVTWVTASDTDVCPDCKQRGLDWHDVFIRPEPGQG